MIQLQNLHFRYHPKRPLFEGLHVQIDKPGIVGLLGSNGAGKTTSMRILATLDVPTAGDATIDGFSVVNDPDRVRRRLGFMPDFLVTYPNVNVEEYLDFFARAYQLRGRERIAAVGRVMEFTGLDKLAEKPTDGLSKGMKQRLGIAEVLVKEPRVVFLDEPTIGLDPDGTNRMLDLISALSRERQMTIFFSSHLLDQVQRISDRIGIMIKGKLVAAGPLAELAHRGLGLEEGEAYTIEEIYMKYFKEG